MRFPATLLLLISLLPMPMPGSPGIGPSFASAEEGGWLTGSARASWWSGTKNPDAGPGAVAGSLWAKGGVSAFDGKASVHGEGWLRDDSFQGSEVPRRGELREGYIDVSTENFDLRAGRQIIAWGRTDAVNPTDNLIMHDYTLHAPEDADQKSGVGALKGAYGAGDVRIIAVWLPEFRANRLPFPKGTPSMTEITPDNASNQWAAKVEYAADFDCSVSYFDGYDRNPDFGLGASGITMRHGRLKVYGADGAFNAGRYGFRAEAAYLASEDSTGQDPFTKNPVFFAVAGGDRTFGDNLNINLQYLFRQVVNHRPPDSITPPAALPLAEAAAFASNQYDGTQHGLTFRVSDKWLSDTLEAEIAGVIWLQHADSLIRPKVGYALNDAISLSAGVESYQGPHNSFFGRLTDFTTFFAETRWNF